MFIKCAEGFKRMGNFKIWKLTLIESANNWVDERRQ